MQTISDKEQFVSHYPPPASIRKMEDHPRWLQEILNDFNDDEEEMCVLKIGSLEHEYPKPLFNELTEKVQACVTARHRQETMIDMGKRVAQKFRGVYTSKLGILGAKETPVRLINSSLLHVLHAAFLIISISSYRMLDLLKRR